MADSHRLHSTRSQALPVRSARRLASNLSLQRTASRRYAPRPSPLSFSVRHTGHDHRRSDTAIPRGRNREGSVCGASRQGSRSTRCDACHLAAAIRCRNRRAAGVQGAAPRWLPACALLGTAQLLALGDDSGIAVLETNAAKGGLDGFVSEMVLEEWKAGRLGPPLGSVGCMLSELALRRLLDKLCVELGFCLPPEGQQRLVENPPADVLSFTDAVFIEEGLDPSTADRHLYRQVRDLIADSFRRGGYDCA